ncbi:HU family DNA-binding protein [Bacteroides sp. 224]|uniref:HU family DNA-binding protein n=1 Tax=Bacteroides sp. 224 TaxID=2302936 RepID=UPI0013D47810|nr:HU family DNA-binding protein [Bacteroides sp. 224]NDV66876.1 DNA-binding protein [Bacteroides sp. 224]
MSILYDFFETNEIGEEAGEGALRARTVSRGTIYTDRILERMADTSGFKASEIKGVLASLTDSVIYFLERGYNVQVDELGYFSVSLTSRPVKNRQEIRAESIEFNKVNFRAGKKVRTRLTLVEKEKVFGQQKPAQSSKLSYEARAQLLKKFLETHPFATRADYCRLTSTLRSKAIADINLFIKEGWLRKYGQGRNLVYLLNS